MSKHHLHEDPDRTTTVGMARYAVDFFKAALAADEKLGLETGYETVAPVPVMFLAGQSIELILKSYFIHKGISLRDIRLKYGHGLQKSLTDAIELGLSNIVSLTEEDIDTIKLLDELYSSKQLQYIVTGAKTFPVFGPIETVTRKLLFAVGYEVGFPPRDIGNVI
ncbi:MAG: hypothetical protein CMH22_07745 [Methylophaga sp.]|nr:hypothetical protein [Methylophaga sp.]|tara:strand:+ start:23578 stop:24072 length:495 start_codon:yes stop_codon:yes gene_type:complete